MEDKQPNIIRASQFTSNADSFHTTTKIFPHLSDKTKAQDLFMPLRVLSPHHCHSWTGLLFFRRTTHFLLLKVSMKRNSYDPDVL